MIRSLGSPCSADIDRLTRGTSTPLGDRPVAILHVNSGEPISASAGTSPYAKLQQQLASLSRSSRLIQVERSSHYMMLDRPDAVIDAVLTTVEAVRRRAPGR